MAVQIADQYYLKAKSAMSGFCSDWGEVCESLKKVKTASTFINL